MAVDNKLKILEEYKEKDILNYEELNNNMCNSSIIGINLIESIKNYYNNNLKIDVDTSDSTMKQFLESSISNYFINLYYSSNRKRIYDVYFTHSNGKIYLADGVDFNSEFIPSGTRNGIIISKKNNNNTNVYIEHSQSVTVKDNLNINIPDKNNGYDQSITFNGYDINKQGHITKNTAYTINFPSESALSFSQSYALNDNQYKVTTGSIDTYRQFYVSKNNEGLHYNFFLITFYYRAGTTTYFFTLPISSAELFYAHENEGYKITKFITTAQTQQYSINFRFRSSTGSFSTDAIEINASKERSNSADLYVKRVSAFIICYS